MGFKVLVTFRWMSGISSNLFPFKANLSRGKWKKSEGLKSGERTPFQALPFRFRVVSETPEPILGDIQFKEFGVASTVSTNPCEASKCACF
ncbi:hypothetical protein TNCV_1310731 [Trichonephila clavipes]|nr:hypothetical protein TNCV_1310731 [Trichonephila clavipes]